MLLSGKQIKGFPNYIITESGIVYNQKLKRFMTLSVDARTTYFKVHLRNNDEKTNT